MKTSGGICVRDDAIARAEDSAHAIADLVHPDPTALNTVLTQPLQIVDDRLSLWLALGRNAADVGVQSAMPELLVEQQKQGVPIPGFGPAELVSFPCRCADGAPCRLKIFWASHC
eukprot:COSAG02_NODE_262_length_26647_cov_21.607240_13_plen_115_part_00